MRKREKQKVFLQCYRERQCNAYYARSMVNANSGSYGFSLEQEALERWFAEDRWFRRQVELAAKDLHDKVEMKLLKHVMDEKSTAHKTMLIFYCKTQLRDRGYVEKAESGGIDVDEEARRFRHRLMELEASVPPPAGQEHDAAAGEQGNTLH